MVFPWVEQEMKTVDLHDKRLNDRLREVLSQFAGRPTASIPAACGGYAETTAAYRLFDNERATFEAVLAPHREATRRRIEQQPIVVLAQDTTEVDVTRPEQIVEGAGPLDGGSRRGLLLHEVHAFTPDGTPLGTLHAFPWCREDEAPRTAEMTRAQRAATPLEDKESQRWIDGLRHCQEEARRCPRTQFICVADSEADIYELLVQGMSGPENCHWIVRACQNRALEGENGAIPDDPETAASHLREQVLTQPVLYTETVSVRGRKAKIGCEQRGRRQSRESRRAEVEIRAAQVTLRAPWRPGQKLPAVTVNAVLVREINPPANEPPVEWLLLTSLPIDTPDAVREVVLYYRVRWMVEVFFRTLKSGCRVEERRFEHIDRLLPCLAVYLIVAWRTLYTCRMGRTCPELSCEAVFETVEWKALYHFSTRKPPPREVPKLAEMVRLVAQLGGYINRARPDPPGPQTVWIGLQRLHDIAHCYQIFHPVAETHMELV